MMDQMIDHRSLFLPPTTYHLPPTYGVRAVNGGHFHHRTALPTRYTGRHATCWRLAGYTAYHRITATHYARFTRALAHTAALKHTTTHAFACLYCHTTPTAPTEFHLPTAARPAPSLPNAPSIHRLPFRLIFTLDTFHHHSTSR